MKKVALVLSVVALVAAALAAPAVAEPHGITCELSGDAQLSPGLTSEDGKYNVVFEGELANCLSSGDESSGTVKAQATAEGNCAHATAEGHALIKWDTGKKSMVDFTTEDIGALVILEYTVTKSNASGALEGDSGMGVLAFQADPTACESEEGITDAAFTGQVGSEGQ